MVFHRKFFFLATLIFSCSTSLISNEPPSLLNYQYIQKTLTAHARWADSHDAKGDYLGMGLLYYTLTYISKAKRCVCLGSGGGFVPRMMRQAQRDLKLKDSETILIDGNMGDYGKPDWILGPSFFRCCFPEIRIIIDTTHNASKLFKQIGKIDYLHIDADHTLEGVLRDFRDYKPLMAQHGIITFHDTGGSLPCAKIIAILRRHGYQITNFRFFGEGTAILYLE